MADKESSEEKVPFPSGFPKPHETEEWARSIKAQFLAAGVAEVAQQIVPEGKFEYVYPPEMLQPPPKLPKDASWSDTINVDWETVPNYRHALEARRGSSGPSGDGIIVKRLPRRSTSSSP